MTVFNWATNGQLGGATTNTFTSSKAANTINSGDLLILIAAANDSTGGAIDPGVFSTPAGFTIINQVVTGASENIRGAAYFKIAGGAESGAYTVTWVTPGGFAWSLLDYSGAASTPDDASVATNTTTGTAIPAPSISPSGVSDWMICAWIGPDSNVITFPVGFASNIRSNLANSGATAGQSSIGVADIVLSSSGATGTKIATFGATRNSYIGISMAFSSASLIGSTASVPPNRLILLKMDDQ